MKRIIFTSIFISVFLFTVSAQKRSRFKGIITFSISLESPNLPPEAIAMMKGAEMVVYIDGDKRRVDLNMSVQNASVIIDDKAKTMANLIAIAGKKYLINMNEEEIKKEEALEPTPQFKYTDEVKKIAGYECKKVEIATKDAYGKDLVSYAYCTNEIPEFEIKNPIKGLKGFPMEYSTSEMGVIMAFTTKSVKKEKVDAGKFTVPEGYTSITAEEFQKLMSQSAQPQ